VKKATLILVCAAAMLLASAAVAQAMSPKIDQTLQLTSGGVQAHGPFGGWDADEASAVVHVTITQAGKSDSGTSRRYLHGAASWSALATGPQLKPGAAVGHATATVRLTNGTTEKYAWTVAVTLVR
jgi:hypothetical protein